MGPPRLRVSYTLRLKPQKKKTSDSSLPCRAHGPQDLGFWPPDVGPAGAGLPRRIACPARGSTPSWPLVLASTLAAPFSVACAILFTARFVVCLTLRAVVFSGRA